MAASQRPGFTGRSQTPPAQKALVGTFFYKTLFLSLSVDFCLCTGLLRKFFCYSTYSIRIPLCIVSLLIYTKYFIDNLCIVSLVIYVCFHW